MTLYQRFLTKTANVILVVFLSCVVLDVGKSLLINQKEYREQIEGKIDFINFAVRPYLETENKHLLHEFISAISPEDDFKQISILFFDEKNKVTKTFKNKSYNIPKWLIALELFPPSSKTMTLSKGWKEIAEINFVTNQNKFYGIFIAETKNFIISVVIFLLVIFILLSISFKRILIPIYKLTKKAHDVTFNRFANELPMPKETDLQLITKAVNQMSSKLKSNFEQQASEAYRIRANAFRDSISGLGNRDYFNNQMTSWLSESAIGSLILIKHHEILHAMSHNEVERTDALAKAFAEKLSMISIREKLSIYRINPDEFVIMTNIINVSELKMLANNLLTIVNKEPLSSQYCISIGITINNAEIRNKSILMTQADSALRNALNSAKPFIILDHSSPKDSMGKQEWKSLILDAIAHDWITFKYQPATDQEKNVIHQEVFSAIGNGNKYYSAARFLAAVEQLELGELFDCYVINRMIERLTHEPNLGPLTINLTIQSVTSPSFIRWLSSRMHKNSNLSGRLLFEIPENAFINHPDHLCLVTDQITRCNFGFGIDNYGRNFKSLGYLGNFTPNYVKIDFTYTNSLENDEQNFVLSSICRTAHNLNITTIATRVETEGQLNKLSELFVNGFQGFIFERQEKQLTI